MAAGNCLGVAMGYQRTRESGPIGLVVMPTAAELATSKTVAGSRDASQTNRSMKATLRGAIIRSGRRWPKASVRRPISTFPMPFAIAKPAEQ